MSIATGVVRWQSTVDPSRCGVELPSYVAGQHTLEAELDMRLAESQVFRPAFVLTSLGSTRAEDIASAVSRASEFSSSSRMCVALDAQTLCASDSAALRKANVGILLDEVDADTPLSVISTDLIEAVRFDEAFLKRALVDSRSACVLAAMLRLAHDLGLATLGSVDEGDHPGEFAFDYVAATDLD